jgi:hypothetical protein
LRLRSAALSLAALVALVLGHVSAWAHDGTVRHVRCARHGELVDAPELVRAVAGGSWFVGVEGKGGDEHCAIANGIRQDAARSSTTAAIQVAITTTPMPLATAAPRRDRTIDFRIAPKTSPPGC